MISQKHNHLICYKLKVVKQANTQNKQIKNLK